MEIPRWAMWGVIICAIIWFINDPAGMGQFFNNLGGSAQTFFRNLG